MGNKRVAFLCHPYHVGGVTRWMTDAAIALAGKGWEVYFLAVEPSVVFSLGKGRETLLHMVQKGSTAVKTISVQAGREFEYGTPAYCTFVYKKLLLRLPPGTPVILSDDYGIWAATAALHKTYPMIGVLHADEEHYYTLVQKYFGDVSVFACVSDRVKRTTLQRFPQIDPAVVYTIPCGIDLPDVAFAAHNIDIVQLVYVGRVSEYQKRTSDLVQICALLHQQGSRFHLNIIGDGQEKMTLENKFKDAGLGALVTFHGWLQQKDVSKWLAAADILVLTSDFEGTPVAMMEALAEGCGIVGTRVSGIEDYEQHPLAAQCYRVFDVGDVTGAVAGIMEVATIPVSIRQQAARKLAESEFTMDVCLERYCKAIATIVPERHAPVTVSMPAKDVLFSKLLAFARYLKVSISGS